MGGCAHTGGTGEEKEVYVYARYSWVCGIVKWVILRLYFVYLQVCVPEYTNKYLHKNVI